MHHHPALGAILAAQHRDDLCRQAEQARLARVGREGRSPRWDTSHQWWRLVMRSTAPEAQERPCSGIAA
jgi:hypothetical protein